jgi:hypothetical protein
MRKGLLFLSLMAFGCSGGTGPDGGPLRVRAVPPVLTLTNESPAVVYTMVIERNNLAVVDWIPCVDPVNCPGIRPGRDSTMPYSRITGYEPGEDEAIVYWWHLLPKAGGGFEVDEIRQVLIEL